MYNQIERELKILISKEQYEKILLSYEFSDSWKQTNVFYDTDDRQIKQKRGGLRIRTIGNTHIFTLKIRTDSITHIELEKEIPCDRFEEIHDQEIDTWLQKYKIPRNIHPIMSFSTIRQTINFENGQLCADHTIFPAFEDYELEYEYTKEHDGITFFNSLLKPLGITYTKNSPGKISRAFKQL
ncbi:MAG: CYTH domain-containing protein [Erysipelotrichaceae bacterium]|jgi:uncharacterized protein YjbK|nr:CYTH domain-containing protein [Erysipelotrichaceae bacterium]